MSRGISQYRFNKLMPCLPPEKLDLICNIVEIAVDRTDFDGKSTSEIFGEIYTRFRNEISIYGSQYKEIANLKRGLKVLNFRGGAGEEFSLIIDKIYRAKLKDRNSIKFEDLELSSIIMNNCLLDIKKISEEAESVVLNLNKISDDLNGKYNV